jgi:hypothetical protein
MKNMVHLVFGFALVVIAQPVFAQSTSSGRSERHAVLAVVYQFFDAMTARDAAAYERTVVPEGRFFSFRTIDGKSVMRTRLNKDDIAALRAGNQVWRERIWNPDVKVHGPIATVWTPYDFWIDGKFSHCGIDSFDMIKVEGQWKIAGGMYTVETNCKPSPLGPLK